MFKPGDWVEVKPEHDIPLMFRPDGKATCGRVEEIHDGSLAIVAVPIGDADVDEHSQAVPYAVSMLVAARPGTQL